MGTKLRSGWAWVVACAVNVAGASCAPTLAAPPGPGGPLPPAAAAPSAPPAAIARHAPAASNAPASAAEPPSEPEPPPSTAHCKPALDPPAEAWPSLEGCSVTFKAGHVTQERQCTRMACGPELPCCNRCDTGGLALRNGPDMLLLSSSKAPLSCREGRNCDSYKDCDVPPGAAETTGVLWRRNGTWYLDTQRFVHRVGQCSQKTVRLDGSEHSRTDSCQVSFSCDDGQQLSITCDGENDGTNTSLCECQFGDRPWSLSAPVRGEAPLSCEHAVEPCLALSAKRRKK